MAENSKIEWTHHTFNPWIGCTRVSPACDHCYAETWASRYGTVEWGAGKPRKLTSESNWQQPIKWNREAEKAGERKRVFCASLADVFDNEVPSVWRARLFDLIRSTPHLDWLLLTKRIGNVNKMLASWAKIDVIWPNVWLGISVVNQEEADRDIPKLLATPARIRFLSMEPLLGAVEFSNVTKRSDAVEQLGKKALSGIDWVIVGGESGSHARPMHPDWARSLRDQCVAAGVPFFFKQWGEWAPDPDLPSELQEHYDVIGQWDGVSRRMGKKAAGRLLDGRTWDGYPLQSTREPDNKEG
jgi:protein gp37